MTKRPAGPERRRDERVPARVQVLLVQGKNELPLFTEDVSLQGLRLRTDLKLSVRALVRMKLPLGEDGASLACQGMVVHVTEPAAGSAPSLGIQFYAFDGAVRDEWTKLVTSLRNEEAARQKPPPVPTRSPPPVPARSPPPIPTAAPEPVRRRFERKRARVAVYIGSLDDLINFTTHDVSRGGMFLATTQVVAVGERLSLEMRSEDTHPFVVEAIVRRCEPHGNPPGLALEFISDEGGDLERLIEQAVDEGVQEEPVFVATYDPNLA